MSVAEYVIEDKVLGTGFSGPVKLGTSKLDGKKVAVKPFNKRGATAERIRLLRNEALIYLELDHPNIARYVTYVYI
jgi:serine/threonine protein kinase